MRIVHCIPSLSFLYHTDFDEFGQVILTPPDQFGPDDFLEVIINRDNIFEPQEYIEVTLDYELTLPKPFIPKNVNLTSPLESMVDLPPKNSIVTNRKRTVIILQEGNIMRVYCNLSCNLVYN